MQSVSGDLIRAKLSELMLRFWGQRYDANDPEVTRLLQLFNDTRLDRLTRDNSHYVWEWNSQSVCNFDVSRWTTEDQWGGVVVGREPFGTLAAWRAVIAYLMTDYQYLHD